MGFDALDRRALDEAAEARRAAISLAFLPQKLYNFQESVTGVCY